MPEIATLKWTQPLLLHQNASKTLATHTTTSGTLIVSGGDDGALAFLLADSNPPSHSTDDGAKKEEVYASPPVLVTRAHGSAVTACAVLSLESSIYVLTSGNDEWVRLWSVDINSTSDNGDKLTVNRLSRVKTSVADVSSMSVLSNDGRAAKVLVCGVGMEVIAVSLSGPVEEDNEACG